MFLTRDQVVAYNACRELGYVPCDSIILTIHSRRYNGSVLSVIAIKEERRYNLRFLVRKNVAELISADILENNFERITDNISTCIQINSIRTPVILAKS
jgi:hypothetical protein